MAEYPRVAILVLNYNGADCLPRCLQSLRALKYPQYHVVVIDNGSEDGSFEEAKQNFPECHYLAKESNAGFAAGMNTGIIYAEQKGYDLVWLLNYDAEVLPDTLTALVEAYTNDPSREALSPVIQNPDQSIWFAGGHVNYFRMRTEHTQNILHNTPYQTRFLTGCAPLFTTALLQELKGFDERFFLYYEDADLSCRILGTGRSLWVVPEARVIHAEKSNASQKKVYYLVYSGLLFFALHTPPQFRLYMVGYVTIRRLVNRIKLYFSRSSAAFVSQAYADYFRKFQPGNQLYLRKLP